MAVRTAAGRLAKYRSMRDFGLTAEPSGERTRAHQGNSFVIQKHAARRLQGTKLSGRWHLVRTRPDGKSETWLLFKGRDEAANQNEILQQLPLGFKLTNLDRVLYPEQNITKGQLIAYLAVAAEWMLPHVANRPLTLVRCPEGRAKPCFFQKHILKGSPSPIHRLPITEEDGEVVQYMRIDDMPGLVALAQLGCLEIHTWGSHIDQVERPDTMVFDLDPDDGLAWDKVVLAALDLRGFLNGLGLISFVKTTGGKGLHVVVPVKRGLDWDECKEFTRLVSEAFERKFPDRFTTNMAKKARKGKIFVDYLRNGRNATFIAPYSPRARDGAPVAVPITWEELAKGVDPAAWTMLTVPRRLAQLEADPWKDMATTRQAITAAMWKAVGRKGPR